MTTGIGGCKPGHGVTLGEFVMVHRGRDAIIDGAAAPSVNLERSAVGSAGNLSEKPAKIMAVKM
jgi:hypothetical protein